METPFRPGKEFLFKVAIILFAALHAIPFLAGYRLSADDVAYHWFAMNGIDESIRFIKEAAIGQGRIVHFPDLITSLIGAYYADILGFRIFYVLLFFSTFFLFSTYINKAFGLNLTWYVFFILLALHPLDYFHTSPGAYPFKISFPIFFILISRIKILSIRSDPQGSLLSREFPWLCLCLAGMLFSEYAFAFATSLILIELISRITISIAKESNTSPVKRLSQQILSNKTFRDCFLIALFLLLYIGFRLVFPSTYDGNKLPQSFDLRLFSKTLVAHIVGGSTISSYMRTPSWDILTNNSIRPHQFIELATTCALSFYISLKSIEHVIQSQKNSRTALTVVTSGCCALALSVIITLPVAITTKYQSWCTSFSNCIFLDSSLSYIGFGTFIAFSSILIINTKSKVTTIYPYVFASIISLIATTSSLNNLHIETSMRNYVTGWDRVNLIACNPSIASKTTSLSNFIDPSHQISMHPNFDHDRYWSLLVEQQKKKISQVECDIKNSTAFIGVTKHERVTFSQNDKGRQLLINGWANPESWGVWSNSNQASLLIPVTQSHAAIEIEANALITPSHSSQTVDIFINDEFFESFKLYKSTANFINIDTDKIRQRFSPKGGSLILSFYFHDAKSPSALGINADERNLAIGLVAITIN
ncbi:leucine-rich repeat domain-containing protein [Diaphorobacter caeni]|uniref:hypothetical protein n=1 Tax=Diaphorobacter caeni TaxID=2784387 RepID=UPI00188DF17E|nr:hypothetical protein [Diaphorobacter caeni]MBF5003872.1 hypothetical protein [Diaphorobacter caeni]